MTNTITDTRFTAINNIAENAEYYTALSALDRATIACMLFDAGYNSSYAKRVNSSYHKRQQWDLCRAMASDIIRYCEAVKGFLDNEGFYFSYTGNGWVSGYRYAANPDGSFRDNKHGREIYCPRGALKCLVEAANLLDESFHDVYQNKANCTNGTKMCHLAQFTNGIEKVIQRASGRKKAAKTMQLYREAIRHRNTVWAIKYNL
jgi:hypothetical protein